MSGVWTRPPPRETERTRAASLRSPASSLAAVMGAVRMQRKGASARTGRGYGRKGVAELGFVRTKAGELESRLRPPPPGGGQTRGKIGLAGLLQAHTLHAHQQAERHYALITTLKPIGQSIKVRSQQGGSEERSWRLTTRSPLPVW